MVGKKKGTRITALLLAAAMLLLAGCGGENADNLVKTQTTKEAAADHTENSNTGNGMKENETQDGETTDAMVIEETLGKYVETSIQLSVNTEEGWLESICKNEDGTLTVFAQNGDKWTSSDNGKTWEAQKDTALAEWIKRIQRSAIVEMTPEGILFAAVLDWEKDVMENLESGDFGDQIISYFYQKPEEEPIQGQFVIPADDSVYDAFMTEDGRTWGYGKRGLCEINLSEEKYEMKYQVESSYGAFPADGMIIMTDSQKALLYDYETGNILEQDKILDSFVKKQIEEAEMPLIVKGEGKALYLICQNGIYRHILYGNTMERIIDGNQNALSVSFKDIAGAAVTAEKQIIVCLSSGEILYYDIGSEVPAQATVRVYSLRENRDVRRMTVAYKKAHPEIEVIYETGQKDGEGITSEDAIRILNTEIVAGSGPDILILDDMPVDAYKEKGILSDISGIVEELQKGEGLLPQIIEPYKEDDGSIYQIPAHFVVNLMMGRKDIMDKVHDFSSMMSEAAKGIVPDHTFSVIGLNPYDMLDRLLPSCMGVWVKDGTDLDKEKILEFYTLLDKVWDAKLEGMKQSSFADSIEDWNVYYQRQPESFEYGGWVGERSILFNFIYGPFTKEDVILSIGTIGSIGYEFKNLLDKIAVCEPGGASYGVFPGQMGNVFEPRLAIGISSKAQNQEAAQELVKYMLSSEAAVSKEAVYEFSVNAKAYEEEYKFMEKYNIEIPDEDIQEIREIVDSLDTPAAGNIYLKNAAIDAGLKMMKGDITPEVAVKEVVDKMELYLSE